MSQNSSFPSTRDTPWSWPVNIALYDRTPSLSEQECLELDRRFGTTHIPPRKETWGVLQRLLQPLYDVLMHIDEPRPIRSDVIRVMAIEMHRRRVSFWAWTSEEWRDIIGPDRANFAQRYGWQRTSHSAGAPRQLLPFLAYVFCLSYPIDALFEAFRCSRSPAGSLVWGSLKRRFSSSQRFSGVGDTSCMSAKALQSSE